MTRVYLAEIWRYPVKSMAGERLERTELGPLGFPGDRGIDVVAAHGGLVTARTRPHLLVCVLYDSDAHSSWSAIDEDVGGPHWI